MSTRTRRLIGLAIAAVLTATPVAPAGADEAVDSIIDDLERVTERLHKAADLAERHMDASWDRAVGIAVNTASLNRLERNMATSRVTVSESLEPLIGEQSVGVVPVAIAAALSTRDTDVAEQFQVAIALDAWFGYRSAIDRAEAIRDTLRRRLGLPLVDGLRTCPLEANSIFVDDWGERRDWWRTHKGTDINAEEGTRLVAMERGEVIQLGWHYLGGNGLYILGDTTQDVYYYAHLSAYADGIDEGTPVEAGQVVAYVGSTGNSDVPHLHLGWMPGTGKVDLDALTDAYPMLKALCL